mgnify:CR=1 FL=1
MLPFSTGERIALEQILEHFSNRFSAVCIVGKLDALSITSAVGRTFTRHGEYGFTKLSGHFGEFTDEPLKEAIAVRHS